MGSGQGCQRGESGQGTAVANLRKELLVVARKGGKHLQVVDAGGWGRRQGGWWLCAWVSWGGEAGEKIN